MDQAKATLACGPGATGHAPAKSRAVGTCRGRFARAGRRRGFRSAFHPLDSRLPVIPAGLPSDLLERRPDVAAAERRVAAQNARDWRGHRRLLSRRFNLTGQTGFDSGDLGLLFNWESRIWSYGPNIQFPIFEGGQISANVKQQRAAYEENVADYRQQVLVAFQDVEDSLSALRYLAQQAEAENRAFESYKKALDLTNARYTTGLVSYFDVIQAQGLALGAEQLTVQIEGNRIAATVRLIKALGGGWADSYITSPSMGIMSLLPRLLPRFWTRRADHLFRRPIRKNQEAKFYCKPVAPSPEIADLVLVALFVGEPPRANQFLGFPPMLQRAAFRATLVLPNGVRQRLNVLLLLPRLHNP